MLAAVATERVENIAGKTLRMNADQGRGGLHIAHDQGDGFFDAAVAVVALAAKAIDAELAPARGEIGGSYLLDFVFTHANIIAAECGGDAMDMVTLVSNSKSKNGAKGN